MIAVREFGATPNDDQDDTAAIQKALDAFPAGNRIVHVPSDRWIVRDTLKWPDGAHGGLAQSSRTPHVEASIPQWGRRP